MHAIKWTTPEQEVPVANVGNRIVMIVCERETSESPMVDRLVILEATEEGWSSPDPMYVGYIPEDGVVWAWESSIIRTAEDQQ